MMQADVYLIDEKKPRADVTHLVLHEGESTLCGKNTGAWGEPYGAGFVTCHTCLNKLTRIVKEIRDAKKESMEAVQAEKKRYARKPVHQSGESYTD